MSSHIPCVSIGMPVLNSASTIDIAIRSILSQTFRDWELLVIDDGSNDETVKLATSYSDPRLRVVADGMHRGHGARLNQAILLGRGRYFARMDGDDVSYPERLALQVQYMAERPGVDLLGGRVLVFGSDGKPTGTRKSRVTHEEICRSPWSGFHLAHPTWFGHMEWFRKHLYRPEVPLCQDQDLLLRTYETSRFAALEEIILGYREILSLKKCLTTRLAFAAAFARNGTLKRKYSFAAAGVAAQTAKGFLDCIAIGTALDYRLLRHRARPIDDTTVRRWREVWQGVQ
jgi:glycosyltransferase involved in cell wall biosynthesis